MPEAPYSKRLNDAELLGAQLHVSDPRTQFSLLDRVPDGAGLAGIVAGYDYRGTKLRCARPKCGVLHNKGFVVQLDNGQHIIIGHVCGKKLFGADWDAIEKDHERLRARQLLLTRRQAFLTVYPQVVRELRSWRFHATAVQDARRAFSETAPEMAAVLRQRAQRGAAVLSVTVKIDRRAVEAAREAQAAAGRRGARQSEEREETIHTVQGLEFFNTVMPRDLIEKALTDLDSAATLLNPEGSSDRVMRNAFGTIASALEGLHQFVRMHLAARQALSANNVAGIVRWHHATRDPISMEMQKNILTVHRRGRDPCEFRLPVIAQLDDSPLARLEGRADA